MLLQLLEFFFICQLPVIFANPFHKYPYVFLLDIGNEELQTASEQIRVSIPGGSLALRYPAIGEGDSIAHVRVSGIDFGTDLKANIVDGGPGYKYVVIVFMGNPGAAYDAIVTVSTLKNEQDTENDETDAVKTQDVKNSYKINEDKDLEEDSNDSAEIQDGKNEESNEQVSAASNFYDSAENSNLSGKEDVGDEDIHVQREVSENQERYQEDIDVQENSNADTRRDDQDYEYNDGSKEDNDYDEQDSVQNNKALEVDRNLYDKYNTLKSHLYNDVKVLPQEVNDADNEVDYEEKAYSPEDPIELDQMFNDEEVHNDGEKYTDSNNNNYNDGDDSSAVAY